MPLSLINFLLVIVISLFMSVSYSVHSFWIANHFAEELISENHLLDHSSTFHVDLIAADTFRVIERFPAKSDSCIADSSIICVRFNDLLDNTTVDSSTFAVYGSQTGLIKGTYNFADSTVCFDADSLYYPGEVISVSLTSDIRSSSDSALVPGVFKFLVKTQSCVDNVFVLSGQDFGPGTGSGVRFGDMDCDGDLDAVVTFNGPNLVFTNDGMGNFTNSGQSLDNDNSSGVALGDLNGDGYLDAFFTNGNSDPSRVYLNNGSGTLMDTGQLLDTTDTATDVALGDIDADGDLDAIVSRGALQQNRIYFNNGQGIFDSSLVYGAGQVTIAVALCDLDCDNDLDVVYANNGANRVEFNDGFGGFGSGMSLGGFNSRSLAVGDVNGDGFPDIVFGNVSTPNEVYHNDGMGGFVLEDSAGIYNTRGVALGDLDGDYDLDLVISAIAGGGHVIYSNDGTGHFDSTWSIAIGNGLESDLGDIDHDGDLDIGSVSQGDTNHIFENLGCNSFAFLCGGPCFIVDTTADSGPGSLREAILCANAVVNTGGVPDTIKFDIDSMDAGFMGTYWSIQPDSALPAITDAVIIDGLSQEGAHCNRWPPDLKIELNGSNAGGANGLTLHMGASGSTIQGLVINNFSNIPIGGNGIRMLMSDSVLIACNFIGTDISGTLAQPNDLDGIRADSVMFVQIGGSSTRYRNLISGNANDGVEFEDSSSHNTIIGNFMGVDVSGTFALGNGAIAIYLDGGSFNNRVGGLTPGERNILSGNGREGIQINNGGFGNLIIGNYFGTDSSGIFPIPNLEYGVDLRNDVHHNTVGGITHEARNIIAANGAAELQYGGINFNPGANNNTIQGNYIGINKNGEKLGNFGVGIILDEGVYQNLIGGTEPGAGNIIAANGGVGIFAEFGSADSTGNSFLGNSIFDNQALGIDLGDRTGTDPQDVTDNDTSDPDLGPNNLQNFPTLDSSNIQGGMISIEGSLNSNPSVDSFRIEFFANQVCNGDTLGDGATADTMEYGEGQFFIGAIYVNTDGAGDAAFSTSFPVSWPDGLYITSTATHPDGSTSEFGACILTTPTIEPLLSDSLIGNANSGGPAEPGDTLKYTLSIENQNPVDLDNLAAKLGLDPNLTLVPGSITTTPIAYDDTFSVAVSSPLIGANVLLNDWDEFQIGHPGLMVDASDMITALGRAVSVSNLGVVTYTAGPNTGIDEFEYTLIDEDGNTSTAKVLIFIEAP